MGHIHTLVHFDAAVDRVFDLTQMPRYMPAVKEVDLVRGAPDEVGTTYRFHSTFLGRTMDGKIDVLEVERPSLLRTRTSYDNGAVVTWTQRFGIAGSGTDETDDVDYELPPGITFTVLGPVVRRQVEGSMRDSVGPFAELLRQNPAALA